MTLTEKRSSSSQRARGNKSPKSNKDKPAGAKTSPIKGKNDGTKPDEIPDSTPAQRKQPPPAAVTESSNKTSSNREKQPTGKPTLRTILKTDKSEQQTRPEQSEQIDDDLFDGLSSSHELNKDSADQGQTDPDRNESDVSAENTQDSSTHDKLTHMQKLMSSGDPVKETDRACDPLGPRRTGDGRPRRPSGRT